MGNKVNDLANWFKSHRADYEIVETFPKSGTNTYQLHKLKAHSDGRILMVLDQDEKICEYGCGLMCCLIASIKDIVIEKSRTTIFYQSNDFGQAQIIIRMI